MQYQEIISFWFEEIQMEKWWAKDPAFDQSISDRFKTVHAQALACELYSWRKEALGRLAEIIILDQFSRNIYRNQAQAFACDSLALALSQEAISVGSQNLLNKQQKAFLYMPWMHSESKAINKKAIQLYSEEGLEFNLEFEIKHRAIIERFGRYPHRNKILGRQSSPEEIAFLKEPDSSF